MPGIEARNARNTIPQFKVTIMAKISVAPTVSSTSIVPIPGTSWQDLENYKMDISVRDAKHRGTIDLDSIDGQPRFWL
jgi:hypothetical protein